MTEPRTWSSLSEADKAALAEILDIVLDEYLQDHRVIFESEPTRLRLHYDVARRQRRDWSRSSLCSVPDCGNGAVRRSHTIPRASLALIAEHQHVISPAFDWDTGQLTTDSVGINLASTFPGFCTEHELMFSTFESALAMDGPQDYLMQIFRTICREIAAKEHHIRHLAVVREALAEQVREWGIQRVCKLMEERLPALASGKPRSLRVSDAGMLAELDRQRSALIDDLTSFRQRFFDPFALEMDPAPFVCRTIRLSERIPVALTGRGNFWVLLPGSQVRHNVVVILNAFPVTTGFEFFICGREEDAALVDGYIAHFRKGRELREAILTMLEAWMLHGTDH